VETPLNVLSRGFPQHKELNPKIWEPGDGGYVLRKNVRRQLLTIAYDFLQYLNVPHLPVVDVLMIGSLANYNWNPYSDVDLHLLVDFSKVHADREVVSELFDAKKNLYNALYDLTCEGYPVELYVQDVAEPNAAEGVYSLLNDAWIKEPRERDGTLNRKRILQKTKNVIARIEGVLGEKNPRRALAMIDKMKEKIRQYRKAGLEKGGELAVENIVFKILRRLGYIERLSKYKTAVKNRLMSTE